MAIEFQDFGKLSRWNREVVVTEKIDGTNAAVQIHDVTTLDRVGLNEDLTTFLLFDDDARKVTAHVENESGQYVVVAQSRKRIITPGKTTDNAGFAAWVRDNAEALVPTLGVGVHYGEWYGQGIQRNYGLDHKRFALFNVHRWENADLSAVEHLECVPVIARLDLPRTFTLNGIVDDLERDGSRAVPGFMKPEGIVIFHTASGTLYKWTVENDEVPKSLVKG